MRLVAPLRSFGTTDLALAGGKGANLGELFRAGFPVPDGFIVTTDAYTAIIQATRLRIAEPLEANDAAAIRAEFEAITVPAALRGAIAEAYAELGGGPVAVRSSATAEDQPGAAFAGQQDTYLNVIGEEAVIDAVCRCWGSLWTDRAIAYRRKRRIDSEAVRMAVVVQRMVEAETAGVMFTADPVTGDRGQIVIEASTGLGEAVVAGLVTPDRYVLDPRGKVHAWYAGRREVVVKSTAGGGVSHEPGDTSAAQPLPDRVLGELARLGTDVARHFGRPQDIEWAHAQGQVSLLQARPMTALPPPPLRLSRIQRRLGSILLEYLPVRPYPIDMTTWLPHGPAGLMAKVTASFGIHGAFEGFLLEQDGVVDRLVPPSPHPTLGVLRAPFQIASRARRHDPSRWTEDPRLAGFLARVHDLAGQELTTMPWRQLIGVPRQALDLVQPIADLRIDYLPRTGLALLRLLVALKLLRRAPLMGKLILGARTRTEDANRALEALAERVREHPRLKDTVDQLDLQRLKEFGDFHAGFEAFLDEYGHRETASPLLVTPPTSGEAPETVLGLIKVLAAKPPRSSGPTDRAMTVLLDHPLLRGPRSRARIQRWVEAARAGIAFREDSHFYFTMPLPILRRSLLEIGGRLSEAGVLHEPEAVFHLRLDELEGISDPAGLAKADADRLRAAVQARSTRREELSGVRLIDPRLIFPQDDLGDALVSGTPTSGGVVTGPVKVIREPAEFTKLTSGDVLVCPYTNPSWTPLFQRAAAVVVDSGGPGSHAAIVAREYGIPAIMGTAQGTTVLTDGQVVTVDGTTGRVVSSGA
jgi:rifampicin phosphotransferase